MPLTVEQAQQAGEIARQMTALSDGIHRATAARNASVALSAISATGTLGEVSGISGPQGVTLGSQVALSAEESATILNAILAVYQGKLDALQAQLDALTEQPA